MQLIYYYKGKPYSIVTESKMKIGELWIDVVIYQTEYENSDGTIYVREKNSFYKLFYTIPEVSNNFML